MGRRTITRVATAALAGVVLAGCGSGDDGAAPAAPATTTTTTVGGATVSPARPAGATTPPVGAASTADDDWCPVSTEQVSAIVHHDVVEGEPCTWSAPDLTTGLLEIYVSGTDAAHLSGSTERVDGVGDAAAFDVSDALVLEHRGTHWVVQILVMGGASGIVAKDAEIELGKLVVDGIG